jgi:hypothetical protein
MKTPFDKLVKTLLNQYSILEKKVEDEEEDEEEETGGINIDTEDGQGESSR